MVQHGALLNFLGSMQARFALSASDRLLAVTTMGFDIAALELYLPLLCGACVVVSPAETVKDVPALARLIGTSGARVIAGDADAVAGAGEPYRRDRIRRDPGIG